MLRKIRPKNDTYKSWNFQSVWIRETQKQKQHTAVDQQNQAVKCIQEVREDVVVNPECLNEHPQRKVNQAHSLIKWKFYHSNNHYWEEHSVLCKMTVEQQVLQFSVIEFWE